MLTTSFQKTGCKIICGASTTLAVKGLMIIMMMMMMMVVMVMMVMMMMMMMNHYALTSFCSELGVLWAQ